MSLHIARGFELPDELAAQSPRSFDIGLVLDRVAPLPAVTTVRGAGKGGGSMRLGADEVMWALERAARKTELRGDCWWWSGYRRNGYGSLSIRNSEVYLHSLACVVAHGPFEPGQEACHTCDHRQCWNVEHLFRGTRLENVRDMWAKGRAISPPRTCGERQHLARLTDVEIAEIRHIAAEGVADQRSVALAYGCSQSTVWRLVHRKVRA